MQRQDGVDRRRGRRVNLDAPVLVRRAEPAAAQPFQEHRTRNIGLTGLYFETDAAIDHAFSVNDVVTASVSVPEGQRRDFPFTRLAGRGRVVRVTEIPAQASAQPNGTDQRKRVGIALEFAGDVTALTGLPARG